MRNEILIYLIAVLFSFAVFSCSKSGDVGPKGDKRELGIPGINGTSILSGTTNPTSSIRKEGDLYINTQNKTLFGPKKGNDWGAAIVLSGTDGN